MSLFRKSLTAELGGRAQRLAGALTHDRALELKGAARQYAGHAGVVASRVGDDVRELLTQAEKRASRFANHAGHRSVDLAALAQKQASELAELAGAQAGNAATRAGKRASKAAARAGKQASAAAARAGKQMRSHPRTSIAVGAGLGIAALTAAWLLRRHQLKQQAELEYDEHDPTRYRASNDSGDALDGSGEDNPVPGESGLY